MSETGDNGTGIRVKWWQDGIHVSPSTPKERELLVALLSLPRGC